MMERIIDRIAKSVAAAQEGDSAAESRRRFVQRGSKLMAGILGGWALSGRVASGAAARPKRRRRDAEVDPPIKFFTVEEGAVVRVVESEGGQKVRAERAPGGITTLAFETCDSRDYEYCGKCSSTSYTCAARYNGPRPGTYHCYEWIVKQRHCGSDVYDYCNRRDYCSSSAGSWGSRCYGPSGCV